MVYDELYFGGEVVPAVVEKFPVIRKAQRKFTSYNIPGRNGDIIVQQDAYNNVILPYQIWCGEEGEVQTDWTDLAAVLYKDGYQKLSDIADPEHYRKAVFNGPIDAQYYWDQVGRTTLEFNCRPERYRVDGAVSPDSYEALSNNTGIVKWKLSDMSNFLKSQSNWLPGTTEAYEFYIPVGFGPTFWIRNFVSNAWQDWEGWLKFVTISGSSTPATANSCTIVSAPYSYRNSFTYSHAIVIKILIPVEFFDGAPMLDAEDANDPDNIFHIGTAGEHPIINNWMPCYPDIIIHNLTAHAGEVMAAHINKYAIYITYDPDAPYYFINTETHTITKGESLTSGRVLAQNARMDAGIKLEKGENIVYTSEWYEVPSVIPNFWEL